ncbi:MAG: hypothetical protein EXS38_12175 [Opitutus sp.]|nr:hypothetical protein [Opitutus sp.]
MVYIGLRVAEANHNIVYWDEFDTALALVLRLKTGMTPVAFLQELFAVNNEHRMVTSRLIFAASYWLTGGLNFTVINLIGNASLIALCTLLVLAAGTAARRLQLGVILAFGLFQLENYENFLWSGSSIDHFLVLLFVGGALTGLAHDSRTAWLAGSLCALLATLTLAHGLLVWPLGAAMLVANARSRPLFAWCFLGALAVAGNAAGFSPNSAHRFAGLSADGIADIVRYWLILAGTVPAIGNRVLAPWFGAALLFLLGWLGAHGAARRESVFFWLACFGAAALALVAAGRAEQVGGVVQSRYLVLGTLSWSLTLFMLLGCIPNPRRPLRALVACLPLLAAFNVFANRTFAASADSWLECRDIATARFTQLGVDGRDAFSLYPAPERSTRLLNDAEHQGIYRLGTVCLPRSFPGAQPSSRIAYFVDEMTVSGRSAFVRGWAAIRGVTSQRGGLHVVLRSTSATYVFTTVNAQRPDVANALSEPRWLRSGFLFSRRRDRLPTGDYQLGFLIKDGTRSEYIMTDHRLVLENEGRAFLAGAP